MIWQYKLLLWVVVAIPVLMFRIWLQKRWGKIDGSPRSVIMSTLAGIFFVGIFGVTSCVPPSVNVYWRLGLGLVFFTVFNMLDWFTPRPIRKTLPQPHQQSL